MATSKKKTSTKKKPTPAKKKPAAAKKAAKPKSSATTEKKQQFVPVQELIDAFEVSHPEVAEIKAPATVPAKATAWKRLVNFFSGK